MDREEQNGGIPMMENMIGDIARTMQSDRRAQAARNERIAEAIATHRPNAQGNRMRARRAAIAKALIALAARLAPPVPDSNARPTVLTQ
jgi:hypothetical protein